MLQSVMAMQCDARLSEGDSTLNSRACMVHSEDINVKCNSANVSTMEHLQQPSLSDMAARVTTKQSQISTTS